MKLGNLHWLLGSSVGWEMGWIDYSCATIFPVSYHDEDGRRLNGANDYSLRFVSGRFPPARHWRISLYELDGYFCENDLKRHGIGDQENGLLIDNDESLTLHIQNASPGKNREPNWLPAPAEGFFLVLRMFQPDDTMWRKGYGIPALKKIGGESTGSLTRLLAACSQANQRAPR